MLSLNYLCRSVYLWSRQQVGQKLLATQGMHCADATCGLGLCKHLAVVGYAHDVTFLVCHAQVRAVSHVLVA